MLDITLIRNNNCGILYDIPLVFSIGRIILKHLILHEKLEKGNIQQLSWQLFCNREQLNEAKTVKKQLSLRVRDTAYMVAAKEARSEKGKTQSILIIIETVDPKNVFNKSVLHEPK